MDYVSFPYASLVAAVLVLYCLFPLRSRYLVLTGGSLAFALLSLSSVPAGIVFFGTLALGYLFSRMLEAKRKEKKSSLPLAFSLVIIFLPLIAVKAEDYLAALHILSADEAKLFPRPVGLSFYTLLLAAYLADIWAGKCQAEKNPAKYLLFASFFPLLVQGPIARYKETGDSLATGHRFVDKNFVHGLRLILWGLFLKLVLADRAGILVDAVFEDVSAFSCGMAALSAVLYSIQLYADFSSCVCLSIGTAGLFGIRLPENFCHPYFATSIRDFWRRWHITLSSWLRDYVYIPLGGSRRGKAIKYRNLVLTFLVSGFWHGGSPAFLVWGLLHAIYQIAEDALGIGRKKTEQEQKHASFGISFLRRIPRMLLTFLLVTIAWVIFRAQSLSAAAGLFQRILTGAKGTGTFSEQLLATGTDAKDMAVLATAIAVLFLVSFLQERAGNGKDALSDRLDRLPLPVRFLLELSLIAVVVVFGTYGAGYHAKDFIYGEF